MLPIKPPFTQDNGKRKKKAEKAERKGKKLKNRKICIINRN